MNSGPDFSRPFVRVAHAVGGAGAELLERPRSGVVWRPDRRVPRPPKKRGWRVPEAASTMNADEDGVDVPNKQITWKSLRVTTYRAARSDRF